MLELFVAILAVAAISGATQSSDSSRHMYRDRDGAMQQVILKCHSAASMAELPETQESCESLQRGLVNIGFVEQSRSINLRKVREEQGAGAACIIDTGLSKEGADKVNDFYCHGKNPFSRVALAHRLKTLFVIPPLETRNLD